MSNWTGQQFNPYNPLDYLVGLGYAVDTPWAVGRNVLAGNAALQGLFNPQERTTGREMLESWGAVGENQEGLDVGDVAGFGVEMLDPISFFMGSKLLTKGAQAAKAANKGGKLSRASGQLDILKVPKTVKQPWEMTPEEFGKSFGTAWDAAPTEIDAVVRGDKPAFYFAEANEKAAEYARQKGLQVADDVTADGDMIAFSNTAASKKAAEEIYDLSQERAQVFATRDPDIIEEWNEKFSKALGYTDEESQSILGMAGYADRATEAGRVHKYHIQQALAEGKSVPPEVLAEYGLQVPLEYAVKTWERAQKSKPKSSSTASLMPWFGAGLAGTGATLTGDERI